MDVFLIRHAEAADTTPAGDAARPLTVHGRQQARALGDRLRWHDCEPTLVWTSPLVRAVQTAELVAAALGTQLAVDVEPELAPDGNAHAVAAALAQLPAEASAMLVGHGPDLAALAALLVRHPDAPRLRNAEALRLSDGRVRWRFAWNAEAPDLAR